jgi:hypothetical protein
VNKQEVKNTDANTMFSEHQMENAGGTVHKHTDREKIRSALFCDITRRRVVTVHRRFVTACRSHLQGSGVREENRR